MIAEEDCNCGIVKGKHRHFLNELPAKALDKQIGGNHYKDFAIQPVEFIHKNGIGFLEGNAIKYICRWKRKGGKQDIEKAIHYLHMLMELTDDATP